MHFQAVGQISSSSTVTIDPVPEKIKPIELPSDLPALVAESVEDLWNAIFSSGLFSYEQTLEIDEWKTHFLNTYAGNGPSDDASIALFYLYKTYLLHSSNEIVSLFKLVLGLTLPVEKDVDNFIKQNLVADIYEEATEELFLLANENRQMMVKGPNSLKEKVSSLCTDSHIEKLQQAKEELDIRVQQFQQQDEVLKIQAQELQNLHAKKINLLNRVNQVVK